MKNIVNKLVFLLIVSTALAAPAAAQPASAPATVPSVDIKRYVGKWYEIARYPNRFQKDCVGNTTATYSEKSDGKLLVVNECVEKDGTQKTAKGDAKIVDRSTNAKLKVRFAPSFISFLPQVWGDYWVLELDPGYQNVVIGDPKREYLWILSRKPEMDDATYQDLLRKAEAKGFVPSRVERTPQNMSLLKGGVIEK